MTDLVERARQEVQALREDQHGAFDVTADLMIDMADEIERLQKTNDYLCARLVHEITERHKEGE